MKRDIDLVRELMQRIESSDQEYYALDHEEYAQKARDIAHLRLLWDAGLIQTLEPLLLNAARSSRPYHDTDDLEHGVRLTWAGHEFLAAAREPNRWEAAKAISAKVGGLTFEAFKAVLSSVAKDATEKVMRGELPL